MPTDDATSAHLQEINEEIYKRNHELAVLNKTLSLLRKLYQISLQVLDPFTLSEKVSAIVRSDLNMEAVGVFLYDEKTDILKPLKFAESQRFTTSANNQGIRLESSKIGHASKVGVLGPVFKNKQPSETPNLESIWGNSLDNRKLKTLDEESHLKTILLYPLVAGDKFIGLLLLGLNRDYQLLSEFEKESIKSCSDVIAVALDKALLYEQLQILNKQLQALDKARAEFISIASHQLRTPPATVKWYLSAILSGDYGPLVPDVENSLKKAQATNNHLISLIEDMLNVSRIERGKMEFLFEPTNVSELAEAAFNELVPMAHDKKLDFKFIPAEEPIPSMMLDKEKVRQVMNNLMDNSLKYTKAGSVIVKLFRKNGDVEFRVTDTGKGISEEDRNNIFQKYSRGKESIKQSAGLGLGLYVAKIIVEQHKGKIWAESEGEGKGSSFCFSLPIESGLTQTTLIDLTKEQN